MCGIFGLSVKKETSYKHSTIKGIFSELSLLSESRGYDSSGVCLNNISSECLEIIKGPFPISHLLKFNQYLSKIDKNLHAYEHGSPLSIFGHTRLVTNGSQATHRNNQPVVKDSIVTIHNGIITNADELWEEIPDYPRISQIDTEVINSLTRKNIEAGMSFITASCKTMMRIVGTASIAQYYNDARQLLLLTNNGSLYTLTNYSDIFLFASERYFLESLVSNKRFKKQLGNCEIKKLKPNTGCSLNLNNFKIKTFSLEDSTLTKTKIEKSGGKSYHSKITNIDGPKIEVPLILDVKSLSSDSVHNPEIRMLEYNLDSISKLKRCSKCILPETFPFITYDEEGICNYCKGYNSQISNVGIDKFETLLKTYRRDQDSNDCLVPLSGGRDSTFALHMLKNRFNMNPITFTYDWGMVTDLARRNISRVCSKLGVENIIVAANIKQKRNNIKKNVISWLRAPHLGMVPLFMAGDKHFFYYTQKLKERTGIELNIWGINRLETTHFKTGFGGVKPNFSKRSIYSSTPSQKFSQFSFILSNLLRNPSYINSSLYDSIAGHISRIRHPSDHYYSFFDYYKWNENEIVDLIINEYEWETALDTKTTWRIGDGTAGFYNYIYYTIAGFSEIDTFKSNQILEGLISREEALKQSYEENKPRYENIRWYLEVIGVNFQVAVKRINSTKKLYNTS